MAKLPIQPPRPIFRNPPWRSTRPLTAAQAAGQKMPWSHQYLGIPKAWERTQGDGILVAVLDTGCDFRHPDLNGSIRGCFDCTDHGSDPMDHDQHGTWCCGILVGENNDFGIVGIAPRAKLVSIKVLGGDGCGYAEWIAAGIRKAAAEHVQVISMSLAATFEMPEVTAAIVDFVSEPNRAVICSAGNEGWNDANGINFPASLSLKKLTQAVSAIDEQGGIADFSSRGPGVTVAAPGVDILSTIPGGKYAKMSGTSMATPIVAGVVALMLAAGETWKDPAELSERLMETARDIGDPGIDEDSGAGIINPSKLLEPKPAGPRLKLAGLEVAVIHHDGHDWIAARKAD